ncbi:type VI secretion system tip protein VgrG [Serratia rubidaea]|uniref:type VI secretion system Vgr family protein n=1 Tax=Serratia rubidaea TaxID=61652 RepID=UPI00234B25A2|nr:type VI secretion system Vgr family protein [Serratia rubidaea]MDC6119686.1 type VI secretion system tip protein VgrG [Serratia rubidaea]
MDFINNAQGTLSGIISKGLNRYGLDIPSCSAPLDVESFSGAEGMSAIYEYLIRFTSSEKDIAAKTLLNKSACLTMNSGGLGSLTERKVVHGVITHFERIKSSADQTQYLIIVKPFLALLDNQFRTHRFFINKSVPEVVELVLQEHGLEGWEYAFTLKNVYPQREQINQYQESDLTFIQRLLAEVGIFYFFTLQPDTQTEVVHFADQQSAWQFGKILPLNSPSGAHDNGVESVWGIAVRQYVAERSVTANDYNHRQAQKVLLSAPADMTHGEDEEVNYGDVYHYRPRHLESGDKVEPAAESGNFWARLEHERFLSGQTVVSGSSSDATLAPGQVLRISELTLPPTLPTETAAGVIILNTVFTASRQAALQVAWTAMPYSETRCWRPALLPRPTVSGTMTARVTSAKHNDEYAHLSQSGLYWVKFDADRDDKPQGYESMPVRLAKPYGGDTYGMHFPLIQGTEVAIAFHEGDPDRPYIAHALHDSRHPDHVTADNNTRNVLRTAGLNKLRMEDKRGEEHIKLSTEYGGKTQLNLGHNVDAQRALRGEGAELRTDDWVSIRGGKGVFITADLQPKAQGDMLAMQAALTQLKQAQQLTESLRSAAEAAKAELADLQAQRTQLAETLEGLQRSALLLSAPAGIAQVTPKSLQLSAGENIAATSGGNTDFSVLKKLTVAAGERISLYAQRLGLKLFASKGKVEIQAQGDEMALDALKDVRISSSEGNIIISAKQDIVLVGSGGAYIRIGNGEVESGAPDKIIQRAAVWQKFGGQSASQMLNQYQQGHYELQPTMVWAGPEGAVENRQAVLSSGIGAVTEMTTADGKTSAQHFPDITKVNLLLNKDI